MAALEPLEGSQTRTERAYVALKEAILSLRLQPGSLLLEDELAEQLGISKTPVRDALQELERDGLVTRVPYKGTYVTEVSEQDVREIVEIKATLEGLAGRLVVGMFTPAELEQAETFLDAADTALTAGDLSEAAEQGFKFHDFILGRAPNQRLLNMMEVLDTQMYRALRSFAIRTHERMTKSSVEHRHILAALREGDPDQVELAFRHHLFSFRDDVTRSHVSRTGQNVRDGSELLSPQS
ncbi:MAG: GntR family transcriptional regulator [Anaerolineae bacterium]